MCAYVRVRLWVCLCVCLCVCPGVCVIGGSVYSFVGVWCGTGRLQVCTHVCVRVRLYRGCMSVIAWTCDCVRVYACTRTCVHVHVCTCMHWVVARFVAKLTCICATCHLFAFLKTRSSSSSSSSNALHPCLPLLLFLGTPKTVPEACSSSVKNACSASSKPYNSSGSSRRSSSRSSKNSCRGRWSGCANRYVCVYTGVCMMLCAFVRGLV